MPNSLSLGNIFRVLSRESFHGVEPREHPVVLFLGYYKVNIKDGAVPGAVIAIQTFGDFLGFNPHLHMLCSDGCFYGKGMFRVAPRFTTKTLEEIFRHKVFKILLSKGENHGRPG
jgi:hypothetical protein